MNQRTKRQEETATDSQCFAFEVCLGRWRQIINHRTSGKARAAFHRACRSVHDDVRFTDISARKLGTPHSSAAFVRNTVSRGFPFVRCGDRVAIEMEAGAIGGVIVGHNSSANYDVLIDDDAQFQAGRILNCHPLTVTLLTDGCDGRTESDD